MNAGYKEEAKERFGETDAYKESQIKTKKYSIKEWAKVNEGLTAIFAEFALLKRGGLSAQSPGMQTLVIKLKNYITEHYYTCTDEVLSGLGKMYVGDERFRNNIDKCGAGTAELISGSIAAYLGKK